MSWFAKIHCCYNLRNIRASFEVIDSILNLWYTQVANHFPQFQGAHIPSKDIKTLGWFMVPPGRWSLDHDFLMNDAMKTSRVWIWMMPAVWFLLVHTFWILSSEWCLLYNSSSILWCFWIMSSEWFFLYEVFQIIQKASSRSHYLEGII